MGYSGRKTLRRLNLFDKMWPYPHKTLKPLRSIDNLDSGKKHLTVVYPPPKKERGKGGELLGGRREEVRIAAKQ